ncbi:MAG: hypothetical protein IJA14_01155 [Alphaproteobacteria bacterium]|nr:hypothetical protein [Alphaproteobacteria bacterium]
MKRLGIISVALCILLSVPSQSEGNVRFGTKAAHLFKGQKDTQDLYNLLTQLSNLSKLCSAFEATAKRSASSDAYQNKLDVEHIRLFVEMINGFCSILSSKFDFLYRAMNDIIREKASLEKAKNDRAIEKSEATIEERKGQVLKLLNILQSREMYAMALFIVMYADVTLQVLQARANSGNTEDLSDEEETPNRRTQGKDNALIQSFSKLSDQYTKTADILSRDLVACVDFCKKSSEIQEEGANSVWDTYQKVFDTIPGIFRIINKHLAQQSVDANAVERARQEIKDLLPQGTFSEQEQRGGPQDDYYNDYDDVGYGSNSDLRDDMMNSRNNGYDSDSGYDYYDDYNQDGNYDSNLGDDRYQENYDRRNNNGMRRNNNPRRRVPINRSRSQTVIRNTRIN